MIKNTNILIIGGAGFIGSNLVKKLIEEGYKIVVFEQKKCNTQRLPISDNLIIEIGALSDVTNFENILSKYKIDIVLHLASSIIPYSDQKAFISDIENILTPSVALLSLISSLGIKFYYFSSGGTVYGNRFNNKLPILENEETNPISYYGISKLFFEKLILMENNRSNLSYIILRPSNLYGPGQNVNGNQGLIAVVLGKIIKGEEVTIWGDGESVRDYIYIDDLISCVSKLLRSNVKNEILNVGSGKGQSVNDIIEVIRNVSNQQVKVNYDIRRSVDVSAAVLNSDKLLKHIDVNFTSIEEGVSKFYKYLTNKN